MYKHLFLNGDFRIDNEYEYKKNRLNIFLEEVNNSFLREYKKRFPLHFKSQLYVKKFCNKVVTLDLFPCKEEYKKLVNKNEFFELDLRVYFNHAFSPMMINIPYLVNVHKVNKIIEDKKMSPVMLQVSELQKIINPECFDEFDMHIKAKKEGRDLLDKIKSKNPIILMKGNAIVKDYLINGTHRTIQAIRDKKNTIEGYIVEADFCSISGLSEDYQTLYLMMKELYAKAHGVG